MGFNSGFKGLTRCSTSKSVFPLFSVSTERRNS